jgi:serine/threonine-protein kinase
MVPEAAGDCLDDDMLAALMERRLGPSDLELVARHIDACAECRRLVAEAAQGASTQEPLEGGPLADTDRSLQAANEFLSSGISKRDRSPDRAAVGPVSQRYELLEVLGKGGMGCVWLARDRTDGGEVAIKIIDADLAKLPQARARFQREADIAMRLQSPHVVRVHEQGTTAGGQPYLVMDRLVGVNLRGLLLGSGRLSCQATAHIVSHVCQALSVAHAAGLVHRDLKPENIFITNDGAGGTGKVLDFGLAKITDLLTDSPVDPTRSGALLGTPLYMSPEQAQGLRTVDHRTDLWALGVIVFECLTGKRPFTGKALGPLIRNILLQPIAAPSVVAPDAHLPSAVDAWITRALARDKEMRFASAEEQARAFLAAVGADVTSG